MPGSCFFQAKVVGSEFVSNSPTDVSHVAGCLGPIMGAIICSTLGNNADSFLSKCTHHLASERLGKIRERRTLTGLHERFTGIPASGASSPVWPIRHRG